MSQYKDFIPENIAPAGVRRIGVYDEKGNRVGIIPLDSLTPPSDRQKLYSFGALSDIHLPYETAQDDFREALTFLDGTEDVAFTCVCGDLSHGGTADELTVFKNFVANYSAETPVYAVTGNHDAWNSNIESQIATYTGHPLYYSFEHGDDVFVMVGIKNDTDVFTTAELQWLYETLEANRNKRCFVFQHALRFDGCGNPYPGVSPTYQMLETSQNGTVFKSLVSHYKNVIWFHGHSHTAFDSQKDNDIANYDKLFGIHSVHIPSLAMTREYENSAYVAKYAESEGYVVDVYENGIHLRGRDFVKGEFLPIASYWLDTTLQTVAAKTYTDSTGTIKV
jgi:hypothetical protein